MPQGHCKLQAAQCTRPHLGHGRRLRVWWLAVAGGRPLSTRKDGSVGPIATSAKTVWDLKTRQQLKPCVCQLGEMTAERIQLHTPARSSPGHLATIW